MQRRAASYLLQALGCKQLVKSAVPLASTTATASATATGVASVSSGRSICGSSISDGSISNALNFMSWQHQPWWASNGQALNSKQTALPSLGQCQQQATALIQQRGLFSAPQPKPKNPQRHNHSKYNVVKEQPTHDWMVGRYVVDREGTIWRKQAGRRHKRYCKSPGQLSRLKRWKPLYGAIASKFRKLGFDRKYWMEAEPADVPGFHHLRKGPPKRWNAIPDMRPDVGDPALRPH